MKSNSVLLAAIMILCCVGISFAQSGFLKLGDIKGESTDNEHKDWIIIESISHALGQQLTTTAATRGRSAAVLEDLIIIKKLDKSTPKLMELCAKGQVLPELELDIVANDGRVYYKVTLNNVRISSISTSSICDPDCKLIEEVAFNYSKITWDYWDSAGNKTTATYNARMRN